MTAICLRMSLLALSISLLLFLGMGLGACLGDDDDQSSVDDGTDQNQYQSGNETEADPILDGGSVNDPTIGDDEDEDMTAKSDRDDDSRYRAEEDRGSVSGLPWQILELPELPESCKTGNSHEIWCKWFFDNYRECMYRDHDRRFFYSWPCYNCVCNENHDCPNGGRNWTWVSFADGEGSCERAQ